MLMHSWRLSSSSHHPVTALRYRGLLWIWRVMSLIVVSDPWLVPEQVSLIHGKAQKKEVQQLDL